MYGHNGHGRGPFTVPLITETFSVKKICICLLFVLFVFPHTSYELFDFGSDGKDGDVARSADAIKPLGKRPFEKKFKFHKIERVYIDDEENDDERGSNEIVADDKYDGSKTREDDDDTTSKPTDDDSEQMTESDELPFKRARTAHKERRTGNSKKASGEKPTSKKKQRDSVNGKRDTSEEESSSFFGSLFGNLFGGGGSESGKSQERQQKSTSDEDKSAEKNEHSNGIIDWLKWLSERGERAETKKVAKAENADADTLLSYLNRWPFNSFFPIGKPEKHIRMPRDTKPPAASAEHADSQEEPSEMSQENFESVLHTLPSFVASPNHAADTECRQQLQIFHRQLRGNKLWTLQMLDATGKITSGILRGNINQFGDFDQCMQVKTVVKVTPKNPIRVRGKYCLAHIEMQTSNKDLRAPLHFAQGRGLWGSHFGNPNHFVPRYSIANWGVCIPHLCKGDVVKQMIEMNLRAYNKTGVEFRVEVDDDDCYTRTNVKLLKLIKKDTNFAMTIFCFFGLTALCFGSLLYKYCHNIKDWLVVKFKKAEEDTTGQSEVSAETTEDTSAEPTKEAEQTEDTEIANELSTGDDHEESPASVLQSLKDMLLEIINSFSPQRTFTQLLGSDHFETEFPIFNILKLGATFALYVSLKYIMIGHLPIINRDKLVRALDQSHSILFRSPMIYMDVLLMISGFLVAYQLAEEIEQKTHIQLLKRMALKISRYLPTLYVVLLFQTSILPLLGSGPLWTNLVGQNTRLCEQQMWRNFFSVQNAIDIEDTCSPMTIQLAIEVQLYILGPLLVWLYHTDTDAAFFIYCALHAMSVAARYSRTQSEYLSVTLFHGMNISKFYRTANLLFSSPLTRATPYLLGIGTGLLHRSQAGVIEIASELIPVGWLCAAVSLIWCFWSPSIGMHTDFVYAAKDAAAYAAWCPLILGLALAWCIFMFPRDENSILRFLTTLRPILFLSRITFPLQLVTYVVLLYNTAIVTEPRKYHLSDLVNFNEIGVIIIGGIVLAFLIDVPAQNVRKIIINRLFIERAASEHDIEPELSSGAEASEPEGDADPEIDEEEIKAVNGEEESKEGGGSTEDVSENLTSEKKVDMENEIAEDDEEAEEEEVVPETEEETEAENEAIIEEKDNEITEEDEIKKRPAKDENVQEDSTSYRRRRRRISDD